MLGCTRTHELLRLRLITFCACLFVATNAGATISEGRSFPAGALYAFDENQSVSPSDSTLVAPTDTVAAADSTKHRTPIFALKNNLLYDAALTPNLSLEFRLAEHWSLQLEAGFNPWPLNDEVEHKWRHLLVGAEAKYWFCRTFAKDFVGLNAYYSHFNVAGGNYPIGWLYPDVKKYRLQGDMVAAGLSYGWHFVLSKHVGLELEAGVDAGYAWFNRYGCKHCDALLDSPRKWFVAPKAGVNIAIVLPGDEERDDDCPCRKQNNEQLAQTESQPAEDSTQHIGPISPISPIGPISAADSAAPAIPAVVAPILSAPERLKSPVLHDYSTYKPIDLSQPVGRDSDALYVYFELDSAVLKREFANNNVVLDSIVYLVSELMKDSLSEMKMIQIVGFASFDGPIKRNQRLSADRAEALKQHIQAHVEVPDSLFELYYGGEGWADLEWEVAHSDYKLRDQVLRIIREEPDPEKRELKLKQHNYGWTYVFLRDQLLSKQRNSGYIKVYYSIKK